MTANVHAGAGLADLAGALTCTGRGRTKCPPCPTSPWVVLARVIPASSGDVDIRNDPYRRYVASVGAYSFRCQAAEDHKTMWMPQESKVSALIDLAKRDEAAPATATVAARTGTGSWVVVPGNFEVNEGETHGALLAREGDRTLVDPQTGDAIRLAELYAQRAPTRRRRSTRSPRRSPRSRANGSTCRACASCVASSPT